MQIFLETSIAAIAIGASVYCTYEGIRYVYARRKMERISADYIGAIHQTAMAQGTHDSLADAVVMCGGCGGYMKRSESDACPGPEICDRYKEILAEHHLS
jgi:hypothetical protein